MKTQTPNRFEQVVRQRLLDNKLSGRKPDSIRSLARAMANGNQARFETYKRSLFKWMAPGEPNPTPESRAVVADALGVGREELADDDEESEQMTLDEFLKRRVHHWLRESQKDQSPPSHHLVVESATTGSELGG